MGIQPLDFYYVAEDLLENNGKFKSKEGLFRTAISRYYYYLYLEVREIITSLDKKMEPQLKGQNVVDAHKKVRDYLKRVYYIGKRKAQTYQIEQYKLDSLYSLKNALSNLLKMRKDADYELEINISEKEVNDAKERINEIRENYVLEHFKEVLQIVIANKDEEHRL